MKKLMVLVFGLLLVSLVFITLGCGTTSSITAATTTTTTSTTTTTATGGTTTTTTTSTTTSTAAATATISGQVAVSASDISALGIAAISQAEPTFRTLASSGLSGATVRLYQIAEDGTETATSEISPRKARGIISVA